MSTAASSPASCRRSKRNWRGIRRCGDAPRDGERKTTRSGRRLTGTARGNLPIDLGLHANNKIGKTRRSASPGVRLARDQAASRPGADGAGAPRLPAPTKRPWLAAKLGAAALSVGIDLRVGAWARDALEPARRSRRRRVRRFRASRQPACGIGEPRPTDRADVADSAPRSAGVPAGDPRQPQPRRSADRASLAFRRRLCRLR